MHRQAILAAVAAYRSNVLPLFADTPFCNSAWELATAERLCGFIRSQVRCCEPDHYEDGHITGSALVVSADFSRVVLTLHRKLGMWLQLGGHADGHPLIHEVAMREAHEESGLQQLTFAPLPKSFMLKEHAAGLATPLPFDLDVHQIPASATKPSHFHYDIRYLIVAKDSALVCSSESLDLRWFTIEEAYAQSQEASMHRQFAKLLYLKDKIINIPRPFLTGTP